MIIQHLAVIFVLDHQLRSLSVNLEKLSENDCEKLDVRLEKICCNHCDEKFFIPANLDLHVQRDHGNSPSAFENLNSPVEYATCLIKGKGEIKQHSRLFHKYDGTWCKFRKCSATFKTQKSLKAHLKEKHRMAGKKLYECNLCNFWYSSLSSLKVHKKCHSVEKVTFLCLFCNAGFETNLDLYYHTKENHKKEAIRCRMKRCTFFYKTIEQIKEHFENKHKFNCEFCTSDFSKRDNLKRHVNYFHIEKKCKFQRCKFYTDSKDELENHFKEKHADKNVNTEIVINCSLCGESFFSVGGLDFHKLLVHGIEGIKCKKCCKMFFRRKELSDHRKKEHCLKGKPLL